MERRERATGAAHEPKHAPARTEPEARSDAPKSIAGSLLVPADMFTAAAGADEQAADDERSRMAADPADPAAKGLAANGPDGPALTHAADQNPFLTPEAGDSSVRQGTRRSRHESIAALVTRLRGRAVAACRWSVSSGQRSPAARPRARLGTRSLALAFVCSAGVALAVAILTQSHGARSPSIRASTQRETPRSSDPFRRLPSTAAVKRLAARDTTHRPAANKTTHKRLHRTTSEQPKSQPASGTAASSTTAVAASYTPTTNVSTAPTTAAPVAPSTTPSSTSSEPSQSSSQSSSPAHQPAFGANGALGPGSSPDS